MDIPESGPAARARARFWDAHAAVLWRYAFRLTGDQARARYVMHETLLRAQQHPEVLDDPEPPARAWLFSQARDMVGGDGCSTGLMPSNGSDAQLVGDAIAQLSSECRAVLRRSYYQGWTTGQIAADLGVAEDSVKLWLHHALRALRRSLWEMGVSR